MQANDLDRPEPSLVAWGRTARPVALPSFLRTRSPLRTVEEPVDDALFGVSTLALLAAPVAVVIAALHG